MPLVRRTITEDLEHLYTKHSTPHVMYVSPREKQPGDVVVPVGDIDDATLADLAKTHPREYAKAAADRQLSLEDEDVVEDEEEMEPEIEFTEEQEMFLALGDAEAIEQVQATSDPEELAAYLDAELKSAAPRRAVVAAIEQRAKD